MTIEDLYQAIGEAAPKNCPELHGDLLVYAEVQPGVIESGMFYERGSGREVTFRYCTDELEDLLFTLWERWQEVPGNVSWRGLAYLIRDGRLQIDLSYPEQLIEGEGLLERRPRLLQTYFGDRPVDYSTPGE